MVDESQGFKQLNTPPTTLAPGELIKEAVMTGVLDPLQEVKRPVTLIFETVMVCPYPQK